MKRAVGFEISTYKWEYAVMDGNDFKTRHILDGKKAHVLFLYNVENIDNTTNEDKNNYKAGSLLPCFKQFLMNDIKDFSNIFGNIHMDNGSKNAVYLYFPDDMETQYWSCERIVDTLLNDDFRANKAGFDNATIALPVDYSLDESILYRAIKPMASRVSFISEPEAIVGYYYYNKLISESVRNILVFDWCSTSITVSFFSIDTSIQLLLYRQARDLGSINITQLIMTSLKSVLPTQEQPTYSYVSHLLHQYAKKKELDDRIMEWFDTIITESVEIAMFDVLDMLQACGKQMKEIDAVLCNGLLCECDCVMNLLQRYINRSKIMIVQDGSIAEGCCLYGNQLIQLKRNESRLQDAVLLKTGDTVIPLMSKGTFLPAHCSKRIRFAEGMKLYSPEEHLLRLDNPIRHLNGVILDLRVDTQNRLTYHMYNTEILAQLCEI